MNDDNDNNEVTEDLTITKEEILEMTDQECLSSIINFIDTRVTITSGFIRDPDTGYLTHQVLKISSGDLETVSSAEALDIPLQFAGGQFIVATVK